MSNFARCIVRVQPVDIEIAVFKCRTPSLVTDLLRAVLEDLATANIKVEFKEGRSWPSEGEPLQDYVGALITMNPKGAIQAEYGEPIGDEILEMGRNMRTRLTIEVFKGLTAVGFQPTLDI